MWCRKRVAPISTRLPPNDGTYAVFGVMHDDAHFGHVTIRPEYGGMSALIVLELNVRNLNVHNQVRRSRRGAELVADAIAVGAAHPFTSAFAQAEHPHRVCGDARPGGVGDWL